MLKPKTRPIGQTVVTTRRIEFTRESIIPKGQEAIVNDIRIRENSTVTYKIKWHSGFYWVEAADIKAKK